MTTKMVTAWSADLNRGEYQLGNINFTGMDLPVTIEWEVLLTVND